MTLRFSEAFHCLQTLQGAQPYRARLIHHSAHYNHEHDDAGECWNVLVRAAIKHSPLLNSVLLSTQSSSLSFHTHTRTVFPVLHIYHNNSVIFIPVLSCSPVSKCSTMSTVQQGGAHNSLCSLSLTTIFFCCCDVALPSKDVSLFLAV